MTKQVERRRARCARLQYDASNRDNESGAGERCVLHFRAEAGVAIVGRPVSEQGCDPTLRKTIATVSPPMPLSRLCRLDICRFAASLQ